MTPTHKVPKSRGPASGKKKKTRQELNLEGRDRKRLKKHRGNKAGSRNNADDAADNAGGRRAARDPRLGSKVPVPLIADAPRTVQPKAPVEKARRLTPEEELARLENDPRLDALLERLENEETLNQEEQKYVDDMLDRIDALMEELGIELDDDEEDEEKEEDIMQLLRRGNPKDVF
ncbi:Der GTPase-activating protein YihI [Enterobacillus tribolii]|uniref:Der GTPase-activating protein YihI n=1 Tax=Enterobacillus tribolii TaxID=1487935 RepID=A0A370QE29_9GAMM|nr:Der GTPase-activating protein YihI [Enterobacillus tribolii]MBW7984223.1 Der GTPase-activating protein YihI [Enterobacillus tribolii]RDK86627.1 hypothetical protein C8D90_11111 [Enterobacillus tribolii]